MDESSLPTVPFRCSGDSAHQTELRMLGLDDLMICDHLRVGVNLRRALGTVRCCLQII